MIAYSFSVASLLLMSMSMTFSRSVLPNRQVLRLSLS